MDPRDLRWMRGDLLYLSEALCSVANGVLGVLHGLNRVYRPSEYKCLGWICSRLQQKPRNLHRRLVSIFEDPPLEAVKELEGVATETFDLVAGLMQTVDVDQARMGFTMDTDTEPEGG